jgi:peroxiredoxin
MAAINRVALLACICCLACCMVPQAAMAYHANVGERAANFKGYDMVHHSPMELDDYLGRWVFVEFTASWCGPCMRELPNMLKQTAPYVKSGELAVVMVSVDEPDTLKDMKKLIRKHHITYPVIYDGGEGNDPEAGFSAIPAMEWGITGVPATFLINPQGVIVATELRGAKLAGMLDFYLHNQRPIYGLRGESKVHEDGSISILAEVMSPEMKDLELELYLYKCRLVWDESKQENVWDITYANDLYQAVSLKFDGARETTHEFIVPPDENLYQLTYYLKAKVPGGENIGDAEYRGLELQFRGGWHTLLDLEKVDGKFIIKSKLWPVKP